MSRLLIYLSDIQAVREIERIVRASLDEGLEVTIAAENPSILERIRTRIEDPRAVVEPVFQKPAAVATPAQNSPEVRRPSTGIRRELRLLREGLIYRRRARRKIAWWRDYLRRKQTDVVLVLNDNHPEFEPLLIAAARREKVPVALVPNAFHHDQYVTRLRKHPDLQARGPQAPLTNRIFARLFPRWTYTGDGRTIFKFEPWGYLALWFLGGASRYPWLVGTGRSDVLLLDGTEYETKLISHPHPPVVLTGRPALDTLHEDVQKRSEIRARVGDELSLEPDLLWIACSLPNLAEHGFIEDWTRHWDEQRFLLDALTTGSFEVLISLHPLMDPTQYEPLIEASGAKLYRGDLSRLLPAVDGFVAAHSTTTFWALLCGVPTLAIDFYDFGYTWLDGVPGVIATRDKDEFRKLLLDLEEPRFLESLRRDALGYRGHIFDGRSTERVIDMLMKLGKSSTS